MDKILEILISEGREPAASIAKRVGMSKEEVVEKIKQLQKDKIILGYKAVVNTEKIYEDRISCLIEVKVTPEREHGFDSIAKRIHKFTEVKSLYLMSGDYDLLVIIECKSIKDIADFVAKKLATIPNVMGTATYFMLKRYKHDGFVISGGEEIERMPVTP